MLKGYTTEQLKKGVRNPFYHKLCRDVTISVRHEDFAVYEEVAKGRGDNLEAEDIIRSCVADFAKILKEHD